MAIKQDSDIIAELDLQAKLDRQSSFWRLKKFN
jgi:hypothetical protein